MDFIPIILFIDFIFVAILVVCFQMGIRELFTENCRLPYLAENVQIPLHVDDILQQSILSVDERGTIATIVTITNVVTLSLNTPPEEISLDIDQPFVSIIVDKRNKVPLFLSRIYTP